MLNFTQNIKMKCLYLNAIEKASNHPCQAIVEYINIDSTYDLYMLKQLKKRYHQINDKTIYAGNLTLIKEAIFSFK